MWRRGLQHGAGSQQVGAGAGAQQVGSTSQQGSALQHFFSHPASEVEVRPTTKKSAANAAANLRLNMWVSGVGLSRVSSRV